MKLVQLTFAVLALLAWHASPADAQATTAFQSCGMLKAHTPATETRPGSINIGTRTSLEVAPGTELGNGGVTIAIGRELCVHGSVDAATGRVVSYFAFAFPAKREICGTFVDLGVGGPRRLVLLEAEFGNMTLPLERSVSIDALNRGERACFRVDVDASGDAVGVERTWGPSLDQPISACGVVNVYQPADHPNPGRIALGSRAYNIAAGTAYTGDPLGDRTDHTTVGQRMCLSGTLRSGQLTSYITHPMPDRIGGTAAEYTPPTAHGPGLLILGTSRLTLRIAAGSRFDVDVVRGSHCFSLDVDKNGDAAIKAVIECKPGQAAATPSRRPATGVHDPATAPIAYGGGLLAVAGLVLLVRSGGRRGPGPGDSAGPTRRG